MRHAERFLPRLARASFVLALVLGGALVPPAAGQDDSQQLRFQFKDADLDLVLASLSKSLGLTFIQQVPLAGKKITAVSDRPVPRDRAIAFLNSALIQHDVAAVQVGDVVKIVTIEEAKKINHAIRYGSDPEKTQFGDEIITQIIPLEVLDAESVKKELGELTSKSGQFLLNTRANVIVLTDTESNVKRFQAIIKQLDSAVKEVLKLKIFRLKHANAEEIGKAIDEMFKPFSSTQQKNQQGGGGDPRARMMQMMMGMQQGSGGGTEEIRNAVVRTTVEKRSNTLIVQANDSTLRQIEELVTELDQALTALTVVRQYPLEHAMATDVAKVLKAIFEPEKETTQQGNNRGGGQQQQFQRMMQVMRQGGGGTETDSEAPSEAIKVTSDDRTNSVIVAASKENQALISVVVEGLDRKVDLDQEVRVYPLENADAESLKAILEEIFELQQANRAAPQQGAFQQGRGQQGRGQQGGGQQGGGRAPGGAQGASGTGATSQTRGKIRVSADSRTNSLVVTATPEDFESIEKIVRQLDSDKADLESTMVIKLLNADAQLLQGLLTNLLQAQTTGGGGGANRQQNQVGGTSTSATVGGLTGQVRVRADTDSNSLVFVTASRNFETLRRLIAELDQERPQVLIKALIAEVDLDDSTELGVEYSYTDVDHQQSDDPHTQTQKTDFDVANKPNGFTYNFTRNNFTLLVRALRKDGKLKVVSAPRILVQDNEEASINLGSEVPFVTNTRLTNEGTTLNTIQYRDIGIILTVTPSINPQGLVRMVVSPEISEIAPDSQSVQITEGVRSPVFLKNVAKTTVTIRDGQTIVIGGLIQDRVRETEDKIPFLGDIPLIGFLFGNRLSEKKKVELMIFITPYVVHQSDALRELTEFEIANYRLVPARDVIQREIPKMPITVLDD